MHGSMPMKEEIHTLKKQRLKITQFKNVRLIKVNELKLTQVEFV